MANLPAEEYFSLVFNWTVVSFTLLLVINRLYVRIFSRWGWDFFHTKKAWNWADFLVFMAWLITIDRAAEDAYIFDTDLKTNGGDWSDYQELQYLKLQYTGTSLYWLPMYLIKGALLLFYAEFVPRVLTRTWWSIRIAGVVVFVGAFVTEIIYLFGCLPISNRWSLDRQISQKCRAVRVFKYYIVIEVMHLLSDFIVLAIPFFVLHLMKNLTSKQKVSAAIMFALGFISMLCSILMAYSNLAMGKDNQIQWHVYMNNYGSVVEQTTAICVACVPQLRRTVGWISDWRKGKGYSDSEDTDETARDIDNERQATSERAERAERGTNTAEKVDDVEHHE